MRTKEELKREIERLEDLYQINWEKNVDKAVIPENLTEETYIKVLKHIVDTGESVIVAYNKMFRKMKELA